ncbi:MAG: glutaredoxin family protein [Thermoanaerobaculia bacterium]
MTEPAARYELVTRAGCHLCDEMAALLDQILAAHGLTWTPVNVDADLTLRARFGEVVPVLLRDGTPVAKVRVERRELERIVWRRR